MREASPMGQRRKIRGPKGGCKAPRTQTDEAGVSPPKKPLRFLRRRGTDWQGAFFSSQSQDAPNPRANAGYLPLPPSAPAPPPPPPRYPTRNDTSYRRWPRVPFVKTHLLVPTGPGACQSVATAPIALSHWPRLPSRM